MSILLSKDSRVLVQGLTGREGSFHAEQMKAYGTNLVAGVSPGKGGSTQLGIPIFDTVVGPNCPGLVTAGQAKVGIIPNHINREGAVGIVSRSGTLTYEVIQGLSQAGVGQTTSVGIGGDPILGLSFSEVLRLFKNDPATRAVVMIGEIGGSDEEAAADEVISPGFGKPVIGFISGRTAPPGKRMGHAGAIISGNTGTAASKLKALTQAGAQVCDTIEEVVAAAAAAVGQRSGAVPR